MYEYGYKMVSGEESQETVLGRCSSKEYVAKKKEIDWCNMAEKQNPTSYRSTTTYFIREAVEILSNT